MKRRRFLNMGAAALGAAAAQSGTQPAAAQPAAAITPLADAAPAAPEPLLGPPPAILLDATAADHRRRLENIAWCRQQIGGCLRTHLVSNYLAGQCCYNMGEYPSRQRWQPDDRDAAELDRLRDHGIRLLQVHEEWNDSQRLFDSHKLAAVNPDGFRRFVRMVHARGMKIIVYVSSGYFERRDPDFRPEWAHGHDLREIYFRYAHCSPASPGWRAYLLPRIVRILDNYGVDGLYNDLGYSQPGRYPVADEVRAFDESPEHDGALEDLLALIYTEVHRRGGCVKVHYGGHRAPQTDLKVYDYLWVGEGGRNGDVLREAAKNYRPYVVPCLDTSRATLEREDELYLHAIPYLQFPLLLAGRPMTGERASVPGIEYPPEEKCFWTRHNRAIGRHYQAHPEGPHSYGWWDSSPGRAEAQPTHARWLRRYLPLVEEGTWAWLEVAASKFFTAPLAEGVVVSAFANRKIHLAIANYSRQAATLPLADAWRDVVEGAMTGRELVLPPRTLKILQRQPAAS